MTTTTPDTPRTNALSIPWENFAKFVRQLSHDLRNQLNALELQAALVGELSQEPELKPELQRLRELVARLAKTLQNLSTAVGPVQPTLLPYSARDFIAHLHALTKQRFEEIVNWKTSSDEVMIEIDPHLLEWTFLELLNNAFRHDCAAEICVSAGREEDRFAFSIKEEKAKQTDPANWNGPLGAITHGHYQLGLRRARAIIEAHGGELAQWFDSDTTTLISKFSLPISTQSR